MSTQEAVQSVVAGIVGGGGSVLVVTRFILRYVERRLAQVEDHGRRIALLESAEVNRSRADADNARRLEDVFKGIAKLQANIAWVMGRMGGAAPAED